MKYETKALNDEELSGVTGGVTMTQTGLLSFILELEEGDTPQDALDYVCAKLGVNESYKPNLQSLVDDWAKNPGCKKAAVQVGLGAGGFCVKDVTFS